MTATIISTTGNYPFGNMTNQLVGKLISAQTQMQRLQEAIATASSGYTGTPGTEFEAPFPGLTPGAPGANLFGVVPGSIAGEQGQSYAYAVNSLFGVWETFWIAARPYIEQLDNGGTSM
jgi:hypothetical protein